jgi:superfamily II helicase
LSADDETPYAQIFAGLAARERIALKAILSGDYVNKPYAALRRLFELGLIKGNGHRFVLTEKGLIVSRCC